MNLLASISDTLGTSTVEQPADAIFTALSQVTQAVSVLQNQIAELEQLRCLSLIHASQFRSDCEFMSASYRRLRLILQHDPNPSIPQLDSNPLVCHDFRFRQTAPESSSDTLKLRYALRTSDIVCSVQFSVTGELFACADKKFLYLFSESGALLRQCDLPGDPGDCVSFLSPRRLRFSNGGKFIAIAAQRNAIAIFSLEKSAFVGMLNGHQSDVNSLIFASDSRVLYSGGSDGVVFMWDLATFQVVRQLRHGTYHPGDLEDAVVMIVAVEFIDHGRVLLVMFMANRAMFYRLPDLSQSRSAAIEHAGLVLDCKTLPDQIHFATVSQDGTAKIWKFGDVLACVAKFAGHSNFAIAICFSPDQGLGFTGSKDATMAVWGRVCEEPRKLLTVSGFANTVFEIDHHPLKTTIVSCAGDGTVCVWDYTINSS
jgi:WD40 repeat protein